MSNSAQYVTDDSFVSCYLELNETENQDDALLDVDPATGEVLRNPSPDQSPE